MDGSIEQDDLPTTQKPKVSDNSIEVVDVGSEEPKVSADPIKNADDEAAPSVRHFESMIYFPPKLTIGFRF